MCLLTISLSHGGKVSTDLIEVQNNMMFKDLKC